MKFIHTDGFENEVTLLGNRNDCDTFKDFITELDDTIEIKIMYAVDENTDFYYYDAIINNETIMAQVLLRYMEERK